LSLAPALSGGRFFATGRAAVRACQPIGPAEDFRPMRPTVLLLLTALLTFFTTPAHAGFLATLTPEKIQELGLDRLTAGQAAAVDAAVEVYHQSRTAAVKLQAATAAVEEYKARQEPAVIARAVSVSKQRQDEERIERFTTSILGRFTGWGGATVFALDNGQVWQQVGSEIYYVSPVENPAVEIRRSATGYFRLYLADRSWVTVKRIR